MMAFTLDYSPSTAWAKRLAKLFGDRFTTAHPIRQHHSAGQGSPGSLLPDAVVFAENAADVVNVVRICRELRIPLIPFGAGTSLEGQVDAPFGGISLNLSRMNGIIDVSVDDLDCRVQPGVTRETLNSYLRDTGLFFPLDPGADATIGGMTATRASGTNAVRYGTMKDVVLGLELVTSDGEIIRTGNRARKSACGYDLTRLFVGSEGTLGIITEIQLRLFGIPESIRVASCQFHSVGAAVRSVSAILGLNIPVARLELLDELMMRACIGYSRLAGFEVAPTLLVEVHGSRISTEEQLRQIREVFVSNGGGGWLEPESTEARNALWAARHNAYWAARALLPGADGIATDACVPISKLGEAISQARSEAKKLGLLCPIAGHVGDGNFHMLILFESSRPEQRELAEKLASTVARTAIRLGGTCTGEHGIGCRKLAFVEEEHGVATDLMRKIKHALDPSGILNPGKVLAAR